ncbi:OB-fold domain-containing protein [Spirillospora sp. NPDC029432]|uniref:Zn-ribbon domain-containing OB-fold protein n=1 Tax=Spirillospora sp. NPDC029432 TaxID=3154599 RepID=UPI0034571BD9
MSTTLHGAPFGTGPSGEPVLHGRRCLTCGHASFPRQPYGCEACGAAGPGDPLDLPAAGTVRAAATVHRHPDPRVAVPFTLVSVRLDGGPLVRGVHAGTAAAGDRVRARLEGEGDRTALRFESERR